MNKLYTGLALLAAVSLASCKAEGPDDGGKQIPSESTTLTLTPFLSSTYKCNFLGADNKQ